MDSKPLPYERLLGPLSVISADKILKNGWRLGKYPPVSLHDKVDWKLPSQKYRSWNYHMHCLDMVDAVLQAYCSTGNERYFKPALRVALDWIESHLSESSGEGISPFAWYDMAVGLRSYRLAYIFDVATRLNLLSETQYNLVWNALVKHQDYLADDENIAFHSNHGYYQIAGQLALGRRFSKSSKLMSDARQQGIMRMKSILAKQFSVEGIHKEHSPDYHRMVYETLRCLLDSQLLDDANIEEFSIKIEEALSWFILPSGKIVNFGDSDFRSMKITKDEAVARWLTPAMQYVVTGGEIGELPAASVKVFADGGYFVCRIPSISFPNDFSLCSYLAQTAAFHSRTHKHADDLSFIWSEFGRDILVDSGRYGYIGKAKQGSRLWLDGHWYSDPHRVYCESTRAHNTLEFNGNNYRRRGVKPFGSALKRWSSCDTTGLIAVETECKHFGSIRHARVLLFMPAKWLLVFDWFHDNKREAHSVKQWFHLAPELVLEVQQDGFFVDFPEAPAPLQICSLLSDSAPSQVYFGEKTPVMQGWWSGSEREIVPNYAWCFELNDRTTGSFATIFSFSESVRPDTQWSRVNISGRRGRFKWRDDEGEHEVTIHRPAEGDMDIGYDHKR